MKRSRFSEEQIIGILREAQAGSEVKAVCATRNISTATYHAWKRKYGGMEVNEARRLRALEVECGRLKRLVANQAVLVHILKEVNVKSGKPVNQATGGKNKYRGRLGQGAAACRALGLARSSYYRTGRASLENRRVRKEVIELSGKHPRYGYRRIRALPRREGFEVNANRIPRIRREEGLKVSKKQRRMKRLGLSTGERLKAQHPRQVWSWDFVADQTENGSNFRILTLLDEHARESLATHAAWSIRAVDVITVVAAAIASHGAPEHITATTGRSLLPMRSRTG